MEKGFILATVSEKFQSTMTGKAWPEEQVVGKVWPEGQVVGKAWPDGQEKNFPGGLGSRGGIVSEA